MASKQDGAGFRTPEDVARRYRLGDINLNSEEIEQIKQEIVCDTALSINSEAPVQNKVITAAINNKVSKENGKGLSSNDYTNEDKTKLDNTPTITQSDVDRWNSSSGGSAPIGTITMFAGSTAPTGWLMCDGSSVSRTTYSNLFSVIGTTYGNGDGSTTFNLPSFNGRFPVGLNPLDTDFDTLGKTGGSKTHTLTINEIPSHSHTMRWKSGSQTESKSVITWEGNVTAWQKVSTDSAGGGEAHSILNPYFTTNFIIKAKEDTPST